jgi:hypothetical protein
VLEWRSRRTYRRALTIRSSKFHLQVRGVTPRLQVADLLAFEGMKILDNVIGPVKRPKTKIMGSPSGSRTISSRLSSCLHPRVV